jgi:hypothetical protein
LIGGLFNGHRLDVRVDPGVQLKSIKPNALLSNRKFAHEWADGVLEFVSAHAEISGRITGPDDSRQQAWLHCSSGVCHVGLLRP